MDETIDTAANACSACKQYKRKCNKALPTCSTCSRLRRPCTYLIPESHRPSQQDEITLLRARVEELEKLIDKSIAGNKSLVTSPSSSSPAHETNGSIGPNLSSSLFFLDQRYFAHLHCSVQPGLLPVPDDIADILKDECERSRGLEQLISRYFDAVHGWMPIISKARMKKVLNVPGDNINADTAFLLSCMKLLLHAPQSGSLPEALPLYRIIKAVALQLELAGLQSLMVIQGELLIAVYELGHGIYPAAYTTVAQCARQAISIGIHSREAPHFLQPWAEWEEEIRVWWFIVMLDRHVTVGRELRPLCTENPSKHTPLPADGEAWDKGAMIASERLYVSSPTTASASPYARLAQAYNLLGRVIRHCNDPIQDLAFMLDEMSTLHQATSALLELTANEESEGSYVALAVCFSTLMKLHKNFLYHSFRQGFLDQADFQLTARIREYTEVSFNTMRDISLEALILAQSLEQQIVVSGVDKLSPLVLHCFYRAAFWLSYLVSANREDRFVIGLSVFDRVFKALNLRWKAAEWAIDFGLSTSPRSILTAPDSLAREAEILDAVNGLGITLHNSYNAKNRN
ncbi:fungal specific transcription factor protein [Coleophoma cylindrospora]|uniref:Fungal specific transcription factor protein n=1 Tax=Coleophoma cylindrospora TaxID=1849047 RepID=A0A3D8RM66_9HELO|nr:fungal specific transcription factor protein [Coleophoma cylindrospora]